MRAKALGIPAITDAGGEKLALKIVTQGKNGRGGPYVDDEWWIPAKLQIGDGKTQITVDLNHHAPNYIFLPRRLKGIIRDGKVPADIAAVIAPDFPKLEPINNHDIIVYTIERDAPVTVFGVVEMEAGQPVIRPVPRRYAGIEAGHLLLSSFSEEQVNTHLRIQGYLPVMMIGALLAPVLLVAILVFRERRRKRKAALAQSGSKVL